MDGDAAFDLILEVTLPRGEVIAATATDPEGNTSEFSQAIVLTPQAIGIDVKPGAFPNPIHLGAGGVLAVAVLADLDFDPATIDLGTIGFGDARVGYARVAPVHLLFEDVDDDGDLDLLLYFSIREVRDSGALDNDSTETELVALTDGGLLVAGTDSVRVVGGSEAFVELASRRRELP